MYLVWKSQSVCVLVHLHARKRDKEEEEKRERAERLFSVFERSCPREKGQEKE